MIKILIIDDEVKKREMHADIVNLYCPDAKVIGFGQDVKSGIAAIEKYNPDVVLLDIQLPDGTGFDILAKYQRINIIFMSYLLQHMKNLH
jgi:two-component system, LytTR family, response regulator